MAACVPDMAASALALALRDVLLFALQPLLSQCLVIDAGFMVAALGCGSARGARAARLLAVQASPVVVCTVAEGAPGFVDSLCTGMAALLLRCLDPSIGRRAVRSMDVRWFSDGRVRLFVLQQLVATVLTNGAVVQEYAAAPAAVSCVGALALRCVAPPHLRVRHVQLEFWQRGVAAVLPSLDAQQQCVLAEALDVLAAPSPARPTPTLDCVSACNACVEPLVKPGLVCCALVHMDIPPACAPRLRTPLLRTTAQLLFRLQRMANSMSSLEQFPPELILLREHRPAAAATMFQRKVAQVLAAMSLPELSKEVLRKCVAGMDGEQARLFEARAGGHRDDDIGVALIANVLKAHGVLPHAVLCMSRRKLLSRLFLVAMEVGSVCMAERVSEKELQAKKRALCQPLAQEFGALVEEGIDECGRQWELKLLRSLRCCVQHLTAELPSAQLEAMAQTLLSACLA